MIKKIGYIIVFIFFYLNRLIRSNIKIAYDILTPTYYMRPGIVKIPVNLKADHRILALVNLVTMTPGTLSLDLSEDKKTLYIHTLYMEEPEVLYEEIKKLEDMILKAF